MKAKMNVYYSDLKIFQNLGKVLQQKRYSVIEYCKNFMVVEWSTNLGVGGTIYKNLDFFNPYNQADMLTTKGYCYY